MRGVQEQQSEVGGKSQLGAQEAHAQVQSSLETSYLNWGIIFLL